MNVQKLHFEFLPVHFFALFWTFRGFFLSPWKFKCLTIFPWYLDKCLHGAHTAAIALNLEYVSDAQHSYVRNIPFEKMFGIFNELESVSFFFNLYAQLINLSRYFCMCPNRHIRVFQEKIHRKI